MQNRISRLHLLLKKQNLTGFLISDITNIKYLTGFNVTFGFLLLSGKKGYFFTDFRYYERAGRELKDLSVHLIKDNWPGILHKYKINRLGFEAESVSYSSFKEWNSELKGIKLIPTKGLVEQIRQIKEPSEVRLVKNAVKLTECALSKIRLRAGFGELELAGTLDNLMRNNLGAEVSFSTIVAFGSNSSIPHAMPGKKKLTNNQIVLMDFGARINGYSSDLTRTFWVGRITLKFKKIYNVVLTAQRLAIDGIRPGRHICEIDALARNYIKRHGYGKYFGHALGHGIGLSVHELPKIVPKNERKLQKGMMFSIEPGIYIPGWGGVRIEDMVLVTEKGCEVLTTSPKELNDIVV